MPKINIELLNTLIFNFYFFRVHLFQTYNVRYVYPPSETPPTLHPLRNQIIVEWK